MRSFMRWIATDQTSVAGGSPDRRGFHAERDAGPGALCSGCVAAVVILIAGPASAQDALRVWIEGDRAAEARRLQSVNLPYTVRAGDFRLLVSPALELDWNDNVYLSKENRQDDFIVRPLLGLNAAYPLTAQNLLTLDLTFGYSKYITHDDLSQWYLQSGSQLSFDIYVKDFSFNLHDRFSYVQDSAQEAAIANTGSYGNFQNIAGLSGAWNLRDVTLSLSYDHLNYLSTSSQFNYQDHAAEMVVPRAGLKVHPELTVGLEGTAAFTTYDQPVLNDNNSYSAGIYADWHPGKYFSLQPRFGYTFYDFRQTSLTTKASNEDTWYIDIALKHQPTEAIAYALNAGHEIRLGVQSDLIEDWYVRPNVTWNLMKNLTLLAGLFYEHGNELGGQLPGIQEDRYDWYGGTLSLSHPIIKNVVLALNYRLTFRASNVATQEYTQNQVGLLVTYTPK